jgi:hypothetical protein
LYIHTYNNKKQHGVLEKCVTVEKTMLKKNYILTNSAFGLCENGRLSGFVGAFCLENW